jgi:hypothetical protein
VAAAEADARGGSEKPNGRGGGGGTCYRGGASWRRWGELEDGQEKVAVPNSITRETWGLVREMPHELGGRRQLNYHSFRGKIERTPSQSQKTPPGVLSTMR